MPDPLIRFAAALAVVVGLAVAAADAGGDYSTDQLKADLKLLQDAKVPVADSALLDFFKNRLLSDKDRERIDGLIKKMASPKFQEREQARVAVEKEGPRALPLLRKVLQGDAELELKLRAEHCVKSIEKESPPALVMAAARVVKQRRVDGATALLLEYLPLAPDDGTEEELIASIYGLALGGAKLEVLPPIVKAGQLDPIIIAALADKVSARRAIAALVVGRYGDVDQRKGVGKLLGDADAAVRFRAAQGLAASRDQSGVPVLVDLLQHGPLTVAYQAESVLGLIAQDKGPAVSLGETKELREKAHTAWKDWWDKNAGTVDLGRVEAEGPFGGGVAQAKKGAIQFVNALMTLDVAKVAKVTDVPFTIAGQVSFKTRQEFDDFLNMAKGQPPPKDFKFKVMKVVPGNEYIKTAPEVEREFLKEARPAQIQVVYVEGQEPGRPPSTLPLFIRISGGQTRCVGFGMPEEERR